MTIPAAWRWVIFLAAFAGVVRFAGLETSPPGFYLDEAAIATQIACVRQTGADAFGNRLPLFSPVLGGGFAHPPYLYAGVAWTSVFGDSIGSLRALAAAFSLVMLLGLYSLGTALFRDRRAGALAALAGAISPWGFQFARIGWDPAAGPCLLVWACAAYIKAKSWRGGLCAGFLLALAAYSYPPIRLTAALVAIPLLLWKKSTEASWRSWWTESAAAAAALIAGWPLVQGVLDGGLQERFEMLSILSPAHRASRPGASVSALLFENILAHLRPSYLFLTGDSNLRHGTGSFGILGPIDILAAVAAPFALSAKNAGRGALGFAAWGFLAGIAAAAMTWESLPHALRSIGGLPFLSLFTGAVLAKTAARVKPALPALLAIASISFSHLLYSYFVVYPSHARDWFEGALNERVAPLKTIDDWNAFMTAPGDPQPLVRQYYWLTRAGQTCVPRHEPRAP